MLWRFHYYYPKNSSLVSKSDNQHGAVEFGFARRHCKHLVRSGNDLTFLLSNETFFTKISKNVIFL